MIKDIQVPQNKKCLRKSNNSQKLSFKNKMGISLAAIALALGIGSFSLTGKSNNNLILGVTRDIAEDQYENSIPIFSDEYGKTLLTTIDNKKLIITQENIVNLSKNTEKSEQQGSDKLHLISTIDKNNKMITGYTYKKYMDQLIELDKETSSNLYRVTAEGGVFLRSSPELKDNKLLSIPKESILIGAQPLDGNLLWTDVLYFNGSAISKGFVSGKFLEKLQSANSNLIEIMKSNLKQNENKPENQSEPTNNQPEEELSNVQKLLAPEKNLVCIDVSYMTPKTLDKLLQGTLQIPGTVKNIYNIKTNLSKYDRKINCVFFKAAGTKVYSTNLKQGTPTTFKEFAEVCEKNNIPFGVYCYSTSTNKKEAELEYKWFSEVLKQLVQYEQFKMPVAIDVEVAGKRDRQAKVPIKQLTDAKIHLTNLLEEDFGKTILYIPRNAYHENLNSRIFDLAYYQDNLKSGPSHIWHVTPLHSKTHKEALENTASTEPVTMMQVALDIPMTKRKGDLIDINLIDKDAFAEYKSEKYIFSNFVYGKHGKIYFSKNREQEDKEKEKKLLASNDSKDDFEK